MRVSHFPRVQGRVESRVDAGVTRFTDGNARRLYLQRLAHHAGLYDTGKEGSITSRD